MARRAILLATLLALAGGCGKSAPESLTARGLKELRSGRYDEAIATCTQAIGANPDDAEGYLYRGRAYQLRNAMGDPALAIADLGEAIRLAPDSSDAYYYRSLVYRDLGKQELADADDRRAREVDGLLQDVYRRLPDPVDTSTPAKTPEQVASEMPPKLESTVAAGSSLSSDQREMYEQLKEQFEPLDAMRKEEQAARESALKRYRQLLRGRLPEAEPDEPPASNFNALGAQAPPLSPPGQGTGGLPGGNSPATSASAAGRVVRPAPSSPFQPPALLPRGAVNDPAASPLRRQVRSPFPQRAPGATGYVPPPTNPFAPQPSANGQPRPSSPNRYSNPAVRPRNPRDYVP